MDSASSRYLQSRQRADGAPLILRALGSELSRQLPDGQLRALLYLVGRQLAAARPMQDAKTLADFEIFAAGVFSAMDLGWSRVEEAAGAVDFVHGCAPLEQWFGADSGAWAPGLLEGMYAEWMRQLGAGERLDVRELTDAAPVGEQLRFRLAHESSFGS